MRIHLVISTPLHSEGYGLIGAFVKKKKADELCAVLRSLSDSQHHDIEVEEMELDMEPEEKS